LIYPWVALAPESATVNAPVGSVADSFEGQGFSPDLDPEAMSRPAAAAEFPFDSTLSGTAVMTAFPDAPGEAGVDRMLEDSLPNAADDLRPNASDADEGLQLYPFDRLQLISQKSPVYPRRAPEGAEASVDLKLTVTETGDVRGVQVMSSAPDYFTRAAVRAVLDWKFEPVTEMGERVPVRTVVRITFRG
jgi:TonB family protein